MSWRLIFDNLMAYSVQIGCLVAVAAIIPSVLRMRQPGAKLIYWQILLAACLLLPLQPWKPAPGGGNVQVTTVMTAVRAASHPPSRFSLPRGEMLLLLVLAGIAIRLGWLAVGFWKLRRYRRHSRPLEPAPAWSVEATLLLSDEIAGPVTFGWRRPVVLLPARFPQLSAQLQEAILCHEIMHVRRGDWLFTVAEELVRAIFWFHPAIWWLLGEIGLAREQEVDRLAIDITREREPYMDALLAIAGAGAQLDLAPAPLFLRKRHLRHRVMLIVQEVRMSKARLISTLTTGLLALVAAGWLITGTFPLTAEPQAVTEKSGVNDAAGVTVFLNGSQVLHRTPVHYPATALRRGVEGTVAVEVKLDANAVVQDAQVLSGPDELRSAVLESVLEWHFTRDAVNSTRDVQVSFELPAKGVSGGISGGVVGGVSGGVPGGIIGGVDSSVPGAGLRHIHSISVSGLSEQAGDELGALLPVHVEEEFNADAWNRLNQAVEAFDPHLAVRIEQNAHEVSIFITAPGIAPGTSPLIHTHTATPAAQIPAPGATSENPPARIKIGGKIQSAMILSKVQPEYPPLAKTARLQGTVRLAIVIGKDGTVQELNAIDGPAMLVGAAMDAVKQWVYKPTLLNGEAVNVESTVDVNFTLSQ